MALRVYVGYESTAGALKNALICNLVVVPGCHWPL
uniref:Uncharacterized protein n=1 Tax=Arundo donax TaxID=35708 RepID=A0A0A9BLS0_ARUDO